MYISHNIQTEMKMLLLVKTLNFTQINEKSKLVFSISFQEKNEEVNDKSPYTDKKIQKATWQHKNAIKNFDYTTIAARLRTVSWGNESHPTGVVKPVYGIPTFPLDRICKSKFFLV